MAKIDTDVYNFFIENAVLSEAHKRELQEKRGFSEQTILDNKFVSGGDYVFKEMEQKLLDKFEASVLIDSGVFIGTGKKPQINPILSETRIIIPYLNTKEEVEHLRPHKLGLSGKGTHIYQIRNLANHPKEIIITEGEFKAAAGMQYGLPTIALPGISSFSEKKFPELIKVLNDYGVKNITILFDNETKDDPALETYKDNPMNRYDTDFYAYYMGKRLIKENFDVKISKFPDGWRDSKGKVDFDGALATGRAVSDVQRIITRGRRPKDFLREQPDEAKSVLLKKTAQKYHRSHIKKEFNKYVATRQSGKRVYEEIISNFIVKIIATHDTPEGIYRDVIFINEFGEESKSFSLAPEDMPRADSFSTFCLSKGNYLWGGNKDDLRYIWEAEFLGSDGRIIIEPDHVGFVSEEKMWLFGNVAIKEDGSELRHDKNHVFWLGKKGLKALPLGVSSGKAVISEGLPYLNMSNIALEEIRDKFADTIGINQTKMCLGWITANLFMQEIFERYGCFPFLFVTGRRGSGKSTVAEWLMNFFGLENCGKMASDTTPVAIQRYMSYYSCLPFFMDEYRNTKQVTYKNGVLRNAYNRQSAGKGTKSGFGVREGKIRGTLLISGEETPEDNALLTRCLVTFVSEKTRTKNHFNWFQVNKGKFSNHLYKILTKKPKLLKDFMTNFEEAKNYLTEQGSDDRTALNYAAAAAGYAACFPGEDVDFANWVTEETQRAQADNKAEQVISIFLEDLLAMKAQKALRGDLWAVDSVSEHIHLYFHGLYMIWAEKFVKTRGDHAFKAAAIKSYLKEESGYLEEESGERRLIGETRVRCLTFLKSEAPVEIQSLVEDNKPMKEMAY